MSASLTRSAATPMTAAPVAFRAIGIGGSLLLAASLLLLLASILEIPVFGNPAQHDAAFSTFAVVFSASSVLFAAAVFPLALGSGVDMKRATFGIVGTSGLGRGALIAFGLLCALSRELYLVGTYWGVKTPVDGPNLVGDIAGLAIFIAAAIAAGSVVRQRAVSGFARWSMGVALVISLATTVLGLAFGSTGATRWLDCVSALGQAIAGLSFLLWSIQQVRRSRR